MKRKKRARTKKRMIVTHQKVTLNDIIQVYNFFGGIIGIWALVYPRPFELAMTGNIVAALAGIVIMFIDSKPVEFITKDSSRPTVGAAVLLNSVVICIIGSFCSNTVYSTLFWTYFIYNLGYINDHTKEALV